MEYLTDEEQKDFDIPYQNDPESFSIFMKSYYILFNRNFFEMSPEQQTNFLIFLQNEIISNFIF